VQAFREPLRARLPQGNRSSASSLAGLQASG
jgi:hypothetical protein